MKTHQIKLYGASDDLIELEGDVSEEFNGDDLFIRFNDGTQVRIRYAPDGTACWRIEVIERGVATASNLIGIEDDASPQCHGDKEAPHYSDVLVLKWDKPLEIVAKGKKRLPAPPPGLAKAKGVIALLNERAGFDHWWDDVDDESQNDILEAMAKLIQQK